MIYIILIGAFVLSLLGYGALEKHRGVVEGDAAGYSRGHKEFTDLKSSVEVATAKQAIETTKTVANQQEITTNVSTDYQKQLADLRKRYAGLRNSTTTCTSSGSMPTVPQPTTGANAASKEPEADTVTVADSAEDALTLTKLQQWIRDQQANFNKPH